VVALTTWLGALPRNGTKAKAAGEIQPTGGMPYETAFR
jgi:hypothetical protein